MIPVFLIITTKLCPMVHKLSEISYSARNRGIEHLIAYKSELLGALRARFILFTNKKYFNEN
jgi:hypothetical protein